MSDAHHSSHAGPGVLTTEEAAKGVNVKLIVSVGVISIVVFSLSAVIAWLILSADEKQIASKGAANEPVLMGQKEIGIVDFVHYSDDTRLPEWRAQISQKVSGYAWLDKAAGRVRLPIAEGMKKAIAEASSGSAIGAANAVVAHEPDVPRLMEAMPMPAGKVPGEGPIGDSPSTPVSRPSERANEKEPRPPGGGIQQ